MPWNEQRKLMFAKLVLCGVLFEKRFKGGGEYSRISWYITLPPHAPCNVGPAGGYSSKSEAVDRAAVYMEIEYAR